MKKLVFVFIFFLSIDTYAQEKTVFLHPIFYQKLSTFDMKSFYALTPNSKYYEDSKKNISTNVQCKLIENQEYNIKMVCNECYDIKCSSHIKKNHSFSILQDKTLNNQYLIIHKVFDNFNRINYEETLINDGLITIPPYQ